MRDTYLSARAHLFAAPVPRETRTYKPVSHRMLDEVVRDTLDSTGFAISSAEYSSAKDAKIATARYTINSISDADMGLQIGWQNSYNKQLTLKFAIGSRVFICENGMVVGNMGTFRRKHTGEVLDFAPEAIERAIHRADDSFARMIVEKEDMKEIEINPSVRAELIGRLYLEKEIISAHQIAIIRDEIKNPTYDYGAPNSLWETYQYVTYSLKNIHPSLYMDSHIDAHRFFVDDVYDTIGRGRPVTSLEELEVVDAVTVDPNQIDE